MKELVDADAVDEALEDVSRFLRADERVEDLNELTPETLELLRSLLSGSNYLSAISATSCPDFPLMPFV